jgi:hypothetical protein
MGQIKQRARWERVPARGPLWLLPPGPDQVRGVASPAPIQRAGEHCTKEDATSPSRHENATKSEVAKTRLEMPHIRASNVWHPARLTDSLPNVWRPARRKRSRHPSATRTQTRRAPQKMDEGPRTDQIRRPPLLAAAKLFKAHAGRSARPMPVTPRSSARYISFPNARTSTTPQARTVLFIGEAHAADNLPTTPGSARQTPYVGARFTCPNALPCCTYVKAARRNHG